MTVQPQYQELPLASDKPLPYIRLFVPDSSLLFRVSLLAFFITLAGITTPWVAQNTVLTGLFAGVCVVAGAVVAVFALRTQRRRSKAKQFLRERSSEMIDAVQDRYGIKLTETILYSLVQGGSTVLYYEQSNVRVMTMLGSDPKIRRTIMVTPTDTLEE